MKKYMIEKHDVIWYRVTDRICNTYQEAKEVLKAIEETDKNFLGFKPMLRIVERDF